MIADGDTFIWVARAFLNAFRSKLPTSPATVKVAVMAAKRAPGDNGGRGGDGGGGDGDGGGGEGEGGEGEGGSRGGGGEGEGGGAGGGFGGRGGNPLTTNSCVAVR